MSNTPSDAEIEALAQQHLKAFVQFSLGEVWFEGEVEFARAALARWGTPQPVVREPLTLQQIAKAFAEAGLNPDDYPDDVMIEPLVRAIEAAHGITQKGGAAAPDCHHRPPCDECAALAAQRGNK